MRNKIEKSLIILVFRCTWWFWEQIVFPSKWTIRVSVSLRIVTKNIPLKSLESSGVFPHDYYRTSQQTSNCSSTTLWWCSSGNHRDHHFSTQLPSRESTSVFRRFASPRDKGERWVMLGWLNVQLVLKLGKW